MATEVTVIKGNIERAIKIFKMRVAKSGILKDLKVRAFFLTRTERRKRKDREALGRLRKRVKRSRGREYGRNIHAEIKSMFSL